MYHTPNRGDRLPNPFCLVSILRIRAALAGPISMLEKGASTSYVELEIDAGLNVKLIAATMANNKIILDTKNQKV